MRARATSTGAPSTSAARSTGRCGPRPSTCAAPAGRVSSSARPPTPGLSPLPAPRPAARPRPDRLGQPMSPAGLAEFSFVLLVAGGLTLAFAFVSHVAAVALASQPRRVARPAGALVPAAAGVSAIGTVSLGTGPRGSLAGGPFAAGPAAGIAGIAMGAAWGAWLFLGLSMLLRAILVGRGPWGSMFDFGVAFGWGILGGYLLLERRYPIPAIAFIPLGVALFLVVYALTLPPQISPLVPA